jgi:simple sugar transport system permease protein
VTKAKAKPKPEKAKPRALPEPDAGHVLIQELMATPAEPPGRKRPWWRRAWRVAQIPVLAVLSGLILGGVLIAVTSPEVHEAFQVSVIEGIIASLTVVFRAYAGLLAGAFGDPFRMAAALQSGDPLAIRRAFNPILESMVSATPYIFAGLSVALAFRGGLFNIGAEGQIFIGAITAAYVGYALIGLPTIIHLPLALAAGALGGALWGYIPGWLKARTGAHEVINTIMMNYIAFRLSEWLLTGPMKAPDQFNPISPTILKTAWLPQFFQQPIRFHAGFFLALATAYAVYWFLVSARHGA